MEVRATFVVHDLFALLLKMSQKCLRKWMGMIEQSVLVIVGVFLLPLNRVYNNAPVFNNQAKPKAT
jgi:hypothetical protein